jgi:hypothetical protein
MGVVVDVEYRDWFMKWVWEGAIPACIMNMELSLHKAAVS